MRYFSHASKRENGDRPKAKSRSFGTATAQLKSAMKKAEKTTKTAHPSEQNLPGEDYGVPVSADSLPSTSSITEPIPSNSLTWLERANELISLHAIRLTESGRDHFRVTIEPGNSITLSLELRWHTDGIAVRAQIVSGDFNQLSQYWPDLQQQLQPRGINLASLEPQSRATQKPPSQPLHENASNTSAKHGGTGFAFGGSMTESPISRRQRSRTPSKCGGAT